MPSPRFYLAMSGVFGALAVALGAFGAHALKTRLSEYALSIFQTGVQYHMLHTVALLCCALLSQRLQSPHVHVAALAFMAGIVLFSGSLYGLALSAARFLGPITPLGGLCFIAGWVALVFAAVKLPEG